MGYDCTFHTLEEHDVRRQFVPRLLGTIAQDSPMDRVHEDAGGIWEKTRNALQNSSSLVGATTLCNCALLYEACSYPWMKQRGFSLSLWNTVLGHTGFEVPDWIFDRPNHLFDPVFEAYPHLERHHLPNRITENWMTGAFIRALDVPRALQWLAGVLDRLPRREREILSSLRSTLRYAADNGLAFWEATDLNPVAGDGVPKIHRLKTSPQEPAHGVEVVSLPSRVKVYSSHVIRSGFVGSITQASPVEPRNLLIQTDAADVYTQIFGAQGWNFTRVWQSRGGRLAFSSQTSEDWIHWVHSIQIVESVVDIFVDPSLGSSTNLQTGRDDSPAVGGFVDERMVMNTSNGNRLLVESEDGSRFIEAVELGDIKAWKETSIPLRVRSRSTTAVSFYSGKARTDERACFREARVGSNSHTPLRE